MPENWEAFAKMPDHELLRRIANDEWLIEGWELWLKTYEKFLDNPELFRQEYENMKTRISEVESSRDAKRLVYLKRSLE